MAIISTPTWANWFLEVEDLRFPSGPEGCNNDAEFHHDVAAVRDALEGDQVQCPENVVEELLQHPYPEVGNKCEISFGDVLVRLTRVQ